MHSADVFELLPWCQFCSVKVELEITQPFIEFGGFDGHEFETEVIFGLIEHKRLMHNDYRFCQLCKMVEFTSVWLEICLQLLVSVLFLLVQLLLKFYYYVVDLLLYLKLQSVKMVLYRLEVLRLLLLPIQQCLVLLLWQNWLVKSLYCGFLASDRVCNIFQVLIDFLKFIFMSVMLLLDFWVYTFFTQQWWLLTGWFWTGVGYFAVVV